MIGRFPPLLHRRGALILYWSNCECPGFLFSFYVTSTLKLRRLLHDIPPQTFIGPPMMRAFNIIAKPFLQENLFVCTLAFIQGHNSCFHTSMYLWLIFQAVPGLRKQSSWQVFLTRCRQTWCTLSQIQHLREGMTFQSVYIHAMVSYGSVGSIIHHKHINVCHSPILSALKSGKSFFSPLRVSDCISLSCFLVAA